MKVYILFDYMWYIEIKLIYWQFLKGISFNYLKLKVIYLVKYLFF